MSDAAKTLGFFQKRKTRFALAGLLVFFLFVAFVMIINYRFPSFFTPSEPTPAGSGLAISDALLTVGDDLFADWLPNDMLWPTVLLDNPQNFQLGALEMLRYSARVMRDKLTRLRTTDRIDPDCDEVFTLLSNDAFKWVFPSAESRFEGAMDKLRSYRARLASGKAEFYPRADNLSEMLEQYVSLLGGINTRLAGAPRSLRYKWTLAPAANPPTGETDGSGRDQAVPAAAVPWSEIDDNFYYAQGAAYVLRQMMTAIKIDFQEILAVKNAMPQVDSIIEVLDQAQFEPWLVLNGDIGSLLANHSLELHSILENARQKIRNLNDMMM